MTFLQDALYITPPRDPSHQLRWDEMRWGVSTGACWQVLLAPTGGNRRGGRRGETFTYRMKILIFCTARCSNRTRPDQTFSTLHMGPIQKCMMTMMLKGWWSCLLGLLNPRLKLPQPDHTEQRASLPYCQGGDKCTTSVTIPWLH